MQGGSVVGSANEIGAAWGAAVYVGNYGRCYGSKGRHRRMRVQNIAPLRVIPLSLTEAKHPQPLNECAFE